MPGPPIGCFLVAFRYMTPKRKTPNRRCCPCPPAQAPFESAYGKRPRGNDTWGRRGPRWSEGQWDLRGLEISPSFMSSCCVAFSKDCFRRSFFGRDLWHWDIPQVSGQLEIVWDLELFNVTSLKESISRFINVSARIRKHLTFDYIWLRCLDHSNKK